MIESSSTSYQPTSLEPSWQQQWFNGPAFQAHDQSAKPKFYCLDMFPYPSAQGLHVGHPEGYTATDIVSRFKRLQGLNVLHPMGWDAFGLPAENFAIKTGVHPNESTHNNIKTFTRQIKALGFSYDWQREIDTSSPEYYKWTQWMFLQMYQHGLAYRKKAKVNWCDSCQTVLANEQVIDGRCERSQDVVIQKDLEQWFFKTTAYADQLLNDLATIDWPEPIKLMQRNWIGKSEGTEVDFVVEDFSEKITVYTTRVDTLYSGAFIVLAPEHPLAQRLATAEQAAAVTAYINQAKTKTELDRTSAQEKTGVFTGHYAINPINQARLPIWLGDFVLAHYGTGAVFGDAHDDRDFAMAQRYGIPLTLSLRPADEALWEKVQKFETCYTADGILINSGEFTGLSSAEARTKMTNWLEQHSVGRRRINYKLRDWLISRQRYWGAPIPIVYDPEGKPHPVKEEYLPLELPTDVDYLPKGTSPIGTSKSYQALAEKLYGKGWHFEVDTMDTFVCSSWYYLRYCDPKNDQAFADPAKLKQWLPVDLYVGGAEHAVLHLLYARFFHKALQDFGYIPKEVGREPFKALRNQGMILGEDHQKMSKSRGNVINPDDVINVYGADTLRLYEMFMGPFEDAKPWSTESIKGIYRFLGRIYKMALECKDFQTIKNQSTGIHKTIKKVTEDIEQFRFNTAISAMMQYLNDKDFIVGTTWDKAAFEHFLIILSPFAPHLAEDLWHKLGHTDSVTQQTWPSYDASKLASNTATVIVQVNGKMRAQVTVVTHADQATVETAARALPAVQKYLTPGEVRKVIFVPNKLINIVVQ